MKTSFPITHIIGLPGAGKTTLATKLSRKYHLPIFRIGAYRSRFPCSPIGELDAWVNLFGDTSNWKVEIRQALLRRGDLSVVTV